MAGASIQGKVCVITGATDGIGRAAAYELAARGAILLLHGRDPEKGAAVVAGIRSRSPHAEVEFLPADFASLVDVRRFAAAVMATSPRIDVLVNNAGAIFDRRTLSKDGYEMTFAVNHLAPFLLTELLQGTLQHSAPARIVTTSSVAHKGAKIAFDDLQSAHRYSTMGVYGVSKLANILFTRSLAKRMQGTAVTATCFHPGFVRTGFGRGFDDNLVARNLFRFVSRFARTPEKGAETLVYLAASAEVEGETGGYYVDRRPVTPSAAAQDDAVAERLWQVSEQLVRAQ